MHVGILLFICDPHRSRPYTLRHRPFSYKYHQPRESRQGETHVIMSHTSFTVMDRYMLTILQKLLELFTRIINCIDVTMIVLIINNSVKYTFVITRPWLG